MNKKPLALGIISGLMALSQTANAASDTSSTEKKAVEKTTVITASRTAETVSSLPQTVQVIDQEQILQQAQSGQSLNDILPKLVPGLGVSSETSTNTSQTLRGRSVMILIDGVSQQDNRQVSRTLSTIPADAIERIEVVSGATAVYGAGGAGGLINIITKKASEETLAFETRVGVSMSTQELGSESAAYNFNQLASGTVNDFTYLASVGGEVRNNLFDAHGDQIAPEPAQTSRGDSDSINALLKLGYQFDSDKSLTLMAEYAKEEQDTDYSPDYGGIGVPVILNGEISSGKAVKGYKTDEQANKERTAFTVDFVDQDLFSSTFRGQAYYREREFTGYGFALNTGITSINPTLPAHRDLVVAQSRSEATVYGTKLTFETPLTENSTLIWGADYNMDKGEQTAQGYDSESFYNSGGLAFNPEGDRYSYGPDVDTETKAAFAQLEWNATQDLTIRTGLRYEKVNVDIADNMPTFESVYWNNYDDQLARFLPPGLGPVELEGAEHNYDTWLFNFGSIYRVNNSHELFINYSEGFELPDTSRLLRNAISEESPLYLAGIVRSGVNLSDDVNLDAVEVKNYELGWRGNWSHANAAITLFYNKSDKTPEFNSDYTVDLLDQKKKIYGIESMVDVYVSNSLQTGGTFSYTRGKTNAKGQESSNLNAKEVAPPKLTTYIQYQQANVTTRLQSLTVLGYDKAHKDNEREADIRGYTTLDLLTQMAVGPGQLQFNVANLLNRDYQNVYSQWAGNTYGSTSATNASGRTVAVSYHMEY